MLEPEFADADVARGELLGFACAACHRFRADEGTLIGPNLHGVFGRPAAAVAGFAYSPALEQSGLVWTPRVARGLARGSRRVRRRHDDGVHRLSRGGGSARPDRVLAARHAVDGGRRERFTLEPSFCAQPTENTDDVRTLDVAAWFLHCLTDTHSSTGF